jgi:hypothetical protein
MASFPWARGARRATREEDDDGKDIVVETDDGEVFVQVKSSASAVAEWQKKHGARLGKRAFAVAWQGDKPPAVNMVAAKLERAYRSARTPSVSSTSAAVNAEVLADLPSGLRRLFEAGTQGRVGNIAYLRELAHVYEAALARDREKTERTRICAELDRDRNRLKGALRLAVRGLQGIGDERAVEALAAIAAVDSYYLDERFVSYAQPADTAPALKGHLDPLTSIRS